jgi:hypothetical protein
MDDALERCSQCSASPMPKGTCGRHCAAPACAAELVWHARAWPDLDKQAECRAV